LARSESRSPDLLREYLGRHGLIPDERGQIVGHSLGLLKALRFARRIAASRCHILIRGERGVGKELLARYIHRQGKVGERRPFVEVDSGTLNLNLYASELFGHVRGAYTGAIQDRTGRIVQASGGDLFLDEIGNMPLEVQTGLLRVLEQRAVCPVGGSEAIPVDVRFIAATNEDIEGKASSGGFRQDLLDRLREGGMIYLPPVRERKEDMELLVEFFLRRAEDMLPGVLQRTVEPETLQLLRNHDWPGNIRELRNCITNAVQNYPDVEHLVPLHLNLHSATPDQDKFATADDLEGLLKALRKLDLDHSGPGDLVGALPRAQDAFARLLARLVKAALHVTARPTPENPAGEVLIHPAMKLLTDDNQLTASKAADLIKRCLSLVPELLEEIIADPVLRQAYDKALRLRPRGPAKIKRAE
jgi:DNA-binding NtrC family response regulator